MDVWYHGSIYKFDTFPIFTHFGTEKAGMDAIGKQLRRHPRDRNGGFRHSNLTVTAPRLHAVEFTEKNGRKPQRISAVRRNWLLPKRLTIFADTRATMVTSFSFMNTIIKL